VILPGASLFSPPAPRIVEFSRNRTINKTSAKELGTHRATKDNCSG
jgi:hypothetical protein